MMVAAAHEWEPRGGHGAPARHNRYARPRPVDSRKNAHLAAPTRYRTDGILSPVSLAISLYRAPFLYMLTITFVIRSSVATAWRRFFMASTRRALRTERPRRAERLSRQLAAGERARAPRGLGWTAALVRLPPSGRAAILLAVAPQIAHGDSKLDMGPRRWDKDAKGVSASIFLRGRARSPFASMSDSKPTEPSGSVSAIA